MCCFSRKVDLVADTNIFARASKEGRQFLVYSMRFKAGEELSMILPIPVPKRTKDDAVEFIDLKKYQSSSMTCAQGSLCPRRRTEGEALGA
jgi:hypothetical protein